MKIVALFGAAGAGKDAILAELTKRYKDKLNLHEIVSCTTRPPRQGEIDGVNYYFISQEEFTNKTLNDEMLEATCFRDWWYGTPRTSLKEDKINVGVFNINGLECLEESKDDILPIYISATDKTRLIRQLTREENPDCDEILRRFQTDKKDFYSFVHTTELVYQTIENNDSLLDAVDNIANLINLYY